MEAIIKKIELEKEPRILIVSDIHGNLNLFKKLLTKARYDAKEDYLFILGDFVEKGPNSLDTLHYVMELSKEKNCHVLKGNCEIIFQNIYERNTEEDFNYFRWNGYTLLREMCKESKINLDSNITLKETLDILKNDFSKEYDFLKSLPTVIETDDYIFTHAGIPSVETDDAKNYLRINEFNNIASRQKKMTIVGHYPSVNYSNKYLNYKPHFNYTKNIISIDGGNIVKSAGQLNMLIIKNNDISSIFIDNLPKYKVKDDQIVSSQDSFIINYPFTQIEVLEDLGEFKLCKSLHKSRTLKIPSKFIYKKGDEFHTYDTTNYKHTVYVGDTVSLYYKTSKLSLVKFQGVLGWIKNELIF
jgi:predicted phosphodiesterase